MNRDTDDSGDRHLRARGVESVVLAFAVTLLLAACGWTGEKGGRAGRDGGREPVAAAGAREHELGDGFRATTGALRA